MIASGASCGRRRGALKIAQPARPAGSSLNWDWTDDTQSDRDGCAARSSPDKSSRQVSRLSATRANSSSKARVREKQGASASWQVNLVDLPYALDPLRFSIASWFKADFLPLRFLPPSLRVAIVGILGTFARPRLEREYCFELRASEAVKQTSAFLVLKYWHEKLPAERTRGCRWALCWVITVTDGFSTLGDSSCFGSALTEDFFDLRFSEARVCGTEGNQLQETSEWQESTRTSLGERCKKRAWGVVVQQQVLNEVMIGLVSKETRNAPFRGCCTVKYL